jgi:hypothetical protein
LLVLSLLAAACAHSSLDAARSRLRAGDYAGAQRELSALDARADRLTPAERREVKDDLCLTEFIIGRPAFKFKEQQRTCADAMAEPGSQSADVLARIDSAMQQNDDQRVDAAIKAGDLVAAEAAIQDYETLPSANQVQVARWSNEMWTLVERQDEPHVGKAAVGGAIATLRHEHADERKMSDAAFKQWIVTTATVDGKSMVYDPTPDRGHLKLELIEPSLSIAALNLDRFAEINDAVIARCGCDAHTEVGLGAGDLPAYVARLDPENRRSEVLILLSGEKIGISMR